jgi:hypothetical protein
MGGSVVVVERGGEDIRKVQFPMPCALVLGSEGEGVSKSLLEKGRPGGLHSHGGQAQLLERVLRWCHCHVGGL